MGDYHGCDICGRLACEHNHPTLKAIKEFREPKLRLKTVWKKWKKFTSQRKKVKL